MRHLVQVGRGAEGNLNLHYPLLLISPAPCPSELRYVNKIFADMGIKPRQME